MNILLVAVYVLPAALYLGAWLRAQRAIAQPGQVAAPMRFASPTTLLVLLGLVLHAGSIALAMSGSTAGRPMSDRPAVFYGFAAASSLTLWFGVVMLWLEGLQMRVEPLQVMVLPIAALAAVLPLFFPGADLSRLSGQPLFVPHLLVGTLAYGVLLLAALHAGLMAAAEKALHASVPSRPSMFARWLDQLPPLLSLERILFRLIGAGFVLLTLTAASGVLFSEQVFGRPVRFDHKTVFTVIAWALFGLLLLGRMRWGWRGRRALRLTLLGFAVLLLGYVGSHFVREVILQQY